jgi:hypothetical protein
MTTMKNPTPLFRLPLLISVALLSTLLLLCGTVLLHQTGFVPLARVQAAVTCASSAGTQTALCEGQDPQAQGCVSDGQMVENESVYAAHSILIGFVSFVHSPACKTNWVRIVALARPGDSQIVAIKVRISFATGKVATRRAMVASGEVVLNSPMQFVPLKVIPSPADWEGVFLFAGNTSPIAVPLYAPLI